MTLRPRIFHQTPVIRQKRITAKDLLLRIKAIVAEEPKRLDMRWWVSRWRGRKLPSAYFKAKEPACGTVGCIAGWGAILLRDSASIRAPQKAGSLMTVLVGFDCPCSCGGASCERMAGGLFDAQTESRPGTRAHAREVGKRIRDYVTAHPELATRVIDVKTRSLVAPEP